MAEYNLRDITVCVLSQSLYVKFKIIWGVRTPGSPTSRMYEPTLFEVNLILSKLLPTKI